MEGYSRDMDFRQTGMPWVLPSPHMPTPESVLYYPATGILGELYFMSIGVGYTLPFKLMCAEWINAEDFAQKLNAKNIPGVEFRPIHIKPFYSTGQGKNLQGVEIYISDRNVAPLTLIQFFAMEALAEMYPEAKVFENADSGRFNMFDKVCGSKEIRKRFSKNYKVADMIDYWNKDNDTFRSNSAKYYIYK